MNRFNRRRLFYGGISVILFLILISILSGYAASNLVPSFSLDENAIDVYPSDFVPQICEDHGITVVYNVISAAGGGITNGTDQNDLILGTSGLDIIDGGGGDDCILGGGGDEIIYILWFSLPALWGGAGDDVIIGGGGYDYCIGQGGNNYVDCEE